MPRRDGRIRPGCWNVVAAVIIFSSFTLLITQQSGSGIFNFDDATEKGKTQSIESVKASEGITINSRQLHSSSLAPISFFESKRHKACMFFDWPPWTRSSVVAYSLRECWEKRLGFEMASYNDMRGRSSAMTALTNLTSPFVAMVGQHMHLSEKQLDLLKHSCDYRFYVTIARRVTQRVFFAYKSELLKSKYVSGIDVELKNNTIEGVRNLVQGGKASILVSRLEHYPFDNQTLRPDFVIRASKFSKELMKLLQAFGCEDVLPHPSVDVGQHFNEQGVLIDDVIDSSDMVHLEEEEEEEEEKEVESDGEGAGVGEGEEEIDKEIRQFEDKRRKEEPEPSIEPKENLDAFKPDGPNDQLLADVIAKGVDSGEVVFRKLKGHAHRHNARGLQKIKEILAIRFDKTVNMPVDEEAISKPKAAPIS